MSRFSLQQCFLLRLFPGQVARLGFVCSSTAAGAGNSSEHRHREQQRAQVQGAAASTDAGSSQHSAGHSRTPHRSRDQYVFGQMTSYLKLSSLLCRISSLLAQLSINSRSSSNVYRDSDCYRPCSIIFRWLSSAIVPVLLDFDLSSSVQSTATVIKGYLMTIVRTMGIWDQFYTTTFFSQYNILKVAASVMHRCITVVQRAMRNTHSTIWESNMAARPIRVHQFTGSVWGWKSSRLDSWK